MYIKTKNKIYKVEDIRGDCYIVGDMAAIRNDQVIASSNDIKTLQIIEILINKGITSQEKSYIKNSQNYAEYQWLFCNSSSGMFSVIKSEEEYNLLRGAL